MSAKHHKHGHLQKLDKTVRRDLEHAGMLAEKQADEGANYESN
jgi:hypothetical protein